jgi:hypothetical protein
MSHEFSLRAGLAQVKPARADLSHFESALKCVILSVPMNSSCIYAKSSGKRMAASFCLLAVILLWSPLWAAALESNGIGCCGGLMCAAHGHAKPNHAQPPETKPAEAPMECEHHGGSGISSCTMSCCAENGPAFTSPINFVAPKPTVISAPAQALAAPATLAATGFVLTFEPLSPPPRTFLLSL